MPVFYKTCRDSKYGLLGWAIGIFAFMMLMGWYYPLFSEEQEALEALLESFPDGMWALLGVENDVDMMSGAGFLTVEAFSLMLPIFFSIFLLQFIRHKFLLQFTQEISTIHRLLVIFLI